MVHSRAQIYSAVRSRFTHTPEGNEDRSVPAGYGSRQIGTHSPPVYPGSSLANVIFGSRLVSANSVFSGSRPPSRLTVTTPSLRSLEGSSVRTFTGLGSGEHGPGQVETTAPFLHDGGSFANAKFGGRLVSLDPLLSRGRSPSHQSVASGRGHSERMASPSPSEDTELDSIVACYRRLMEN